MPMTVFLKLYSIRAVRGENFPMNFFSRKLCGKQETNSDQTSTTDHTCNVSAIPKLSAGSSCHTLTTV
jgi:hypothetical protein